MEELASLSLASLTFLDITKMLKGGPLLKEIVDKMSSKILGKLVPDRKMYLYSGHDVTLISFLRALDLDKFEKPGYGAVILLEVTQETNNEDYLVEVIIKAKKLKILTIFSNFYEKRFFSCGI